MPRQDLIQVRRGSRAAFNALTSGSKLEAGELGAATDTQELLVGLGPTVDPFVVANGGVHYFTRVDTGLDGSFIQTYAYIGGDQTGNARGQRSVDIQNDRIAVTMVAAGNSSVAIGQNNTAGSPGTEACCAIGVGNEVTYQGLAVGASNTITNPSGWTTVVGIGNNAADNSSIFGNSNTTTGTFNATVVGRGVSASASGEGLTAVGNAITVSGDHAVVVGSICTASGGYNATIGFLNTNSGVASTVVGVSCENSGGNSALFGSVVNTITNILELRNAGARVRGYGGTGQLALSVQNRATAYAHTAEAEGSEPENTLRPGMFAIRRNGLEFRLDYNDAGVVRSVSLGTVV